MSCAAMIMETVNSYSELEIIDAHRLYEEKFKSVSEQAYYQTLSRMTRAGAINRLTKGIYCKPHRGRFGAITSNESDILRYYLGRTMSDGLLVGYRMYNNYKLTTQISKNVELYSNCLSQDKRKIRNVEIRRVNLKFDRGNIGTIELLEVLQNYKKIEDLNRKYFYEFIQKHTRYYNEYSLTQVLEYIRYKKSTLASLKNVLDYFGVKNTVDSYLNGTSTYDSIKMEVWDESTYEFN